MSTPALRGQLRVIPEPTWPAELTLRRALSAAHARPWNRHHPDASLRLIRGNSRFLGECVEQLRALGAPAVFSQPMPRANETPWRKAGFELFLALALLRLDLVGAIAEPGHAVTTTNDLERIGEIDAAAFDEFWVLERPGLIEALSSTRRSEILAAGSPMSGFAIVGHGSSFSYLQRVAVDPVSQGRGLGTALVLEAARRARYAGNRSLFLNTQTDNGISLNMYRKIGFETLSDELFLLRA